MKQEVSWWAFVSVVGIASIVHWSVSNAGFVWDDEFYVVRNADIRAESPATDVFTAPAKIPEQVGLGAPLPTYRPVAVLLHKAAFSVGQLDPRTHHNLNLALHALAAGLVFCIATALGLPIAGAFVTGLLFAVHPIHVEAVAWISSTSLVASAMFYFAGLWLGLRYFTDSNRMWMWLAASMYALAVFSHESALTLPLVWAVLALWAGFRRLDELRLLAIESLPLWVIPALYLPLRAAVLGPVPQPVVLVSASSLDWISLAIDVLGRSLRYVIVPYPLSAYHQLPVPLAARVVPALVSVGLLLAGLAAALLLRRRAPEIGWSLFLFLLLVLPFLRLDTSEPFLVERNLYLPSFALVLFAGVMVLRNSILLLGALALSAVFALSTINRVPIWQEESTLDQSVLDSDPNVARVQLNLGYRYLQGGNAELAKDPMERAIAILENPIYPSPRYEQYRAHVGLGAVAVHERRFDEARAHLGKAVELEPRGELPYLYLGQAEIEDRKDYEAAIRYFLAAIDRGPLNEVARDYLGTALLNLDRYDEAERYFEEALEINPLFQDARAHLDLVQKIRSQRK